MIEGSEANHWKCISLINVRIHGRRRQNWLTLPLLWTLKKHFAYICVCVVVTLGFYFLFIECYVLSDTTQKKKQVEEDDSCATFMYAAYTYILVWWIRAIWKWIICDCYDGFEY